MFTIPKMRAHPLLLSHCFTFLVFHSHIHTHTLFVYIIVSLFQSLSETLTHISVTSAHFHSISQIDLVFSLLIALFFSLSHACVLIIFSRFHVHTLFSHLFLHFITFTHFVSLFYFKRALHLSSVLDKYSFFVFLFQMLTLFLIHTPPHCLIQRLHLISFSCPYLYFLFISLTHTKTPFLLSFKELSFSRFSLTFTRTDILCFYNCHKRKLVNADS